MAMRRTLMAAFFGLFGAVAVGVVGAWGLWHVDEQTQARLERERELARAYWSSLAIAGVPVDSATDLALGRLRARAAGQRPAPWKTPFGNEREQAVEGLWIGMALNPFALRQDNTPRTSVEARQLGATRDEVRLALAAAGPLVRARVERMWRVVLTVAAVFAAASMMVGGWGWRVRERALR